MLSVGGLETDFLDVKAKHWPFKSSNTDGAYNDGCVIHQFESLDIAHATVLTGTEKYLLTTDCYKLHLCFSCSNTSKCLNQLQIGWVFDHICQFMH